MLSFLKFRKKQKSTKGHKSQCGNGVIFPNSPPPQRHHSTHSNHHLTSCQEITEERVVTDAKASSGVTGHQSIRPTSGLLAAKLECDEWGLQSRSRGISKNTGHHTTSHINHSSANQTHAKVHPQRRTPPRKFLSMAQYVKLADEMRGHKNSRLNHHHHPSYKGVGENYKSRSMKERREFREMQNLCGFNSHKKLSNAHPMAKTTMSALYCIDEEEIGENFNLNSFEHDI